MFLCNVYFCFLPFKFAVNLTLETIVAGTDAGTLDFVLPTSRATVSC